MNDRWVVNFWEWNPNWDNLRTILVLSEVTYCTEYVCTCMQYGVHMICAFVKLLKDYLPTPRVLWCNPHKVHWLLKDRPIQTNTDNTCKHHKASCTRTVSTNRESFAVSNPSKLYPEYSYVSVCRHIHMRANERRTVEWGLALFGHVLDTRSFSLPRGSMKIPYTQIFPLALLRQASSQMRRLHNDKLQVELQPNI